MEQLGGGASLGEERFVGAVLSDAAVFGYEDPVGLDARIDGGLCFGVGRLFDKVR